MKEKLYSIKQNSAGLVMDKSFRVSKRILLNREKRQSFNVSPVSSLLFKTKNAVASPVNCMTISVKSSPL
jgi:hypothetical protein